MLEITHCCWSNNIHQVAVDELKPETVEACWRKLGSEIISDFNDFPWIDGEMRKIIHTVRQMGREGFANIYNEKVEKNIEVI